MLAMSKWFTLTPFISNRYSKRVGFSCRADSVQPHANGGVVDNNKNKKVVVVGSGWAGLGAAQHLCNQVFAYIDRGKSCLKLNYVLSV